MRPGSTAVTDTCSTGSVFSGHRASFDLRYAISWAPGVRQRCGGTGGGSVDGPTGGLGEARGFSAVMPEFARWLDGSPRLVTGDHDVAHPGIVRFISRVHPVTCSLDL